MILENLEGGLKIGQCNRKTIKKIWVVFNIVYIAIFAVMIFLSIFSRGMASSNTKFFKNTWELTSNDVLNISLDACDHLTVFVILYFVWLILNIIACIHTKADYKLIFKNNVWLLGINGVFAFIEGLKNYTFIKTINPSNLATMLKKMIISYNDVIICCYAIAIGSIIFNIIYYILWKKKNQIYNFKDVCIGTALSGLFPSLIIMVFVLITILQMSL